MQTSSDPKAGPPNASGSASFLGSPLSMPLTCRSGEPQRLACILLACVQDRYKVRIVEDDRLLSTRAPIL